MGKYDQIIHRSRPADTGHTPMSMQNRAAQFAPFDALTGFGGRIHETARITDERRELSEDVKQVINERLRRIQEQISEHPEVQVTYFLPDRTKDGGSYQTVTARVLKINAFKETLLLEGDLNIPFGEIAEIQ